MGAVANPLTYGAPPPSNSGGNFLGIQFPKGMLTGGSGSLNTPQNPYMPMINPQPAAGGAPNQSNPYAAGFPANNSGYNTTNLLGTSSGGTTPPAYNPNNIGLQGPNSNAQGFGFPTTEQGQKELFTNLEKAYGKGMAGTLMNFLSSGAGFNQGAVNNLIAAMQPGFQNAQQNLLQQFSAGGSRFSSGAALGLSNLQSQEQLNIGALESQMYEQSVNNYIDVLMGASQGDLTEHERMNQASSSFFSDLIGGIASGAGSIMEGIGAMGMGGVI